MRTVSCSKRTVPRERTATLAELAEDRRRCLAAKAKQAPVQEGNLCACLVTFAAWRICNGCGARLLFVNEQARTTGKFVCGRCDERREAMGEKCKPSLPFRAALHLRALLSPDPRLLSALPYHMPTALRKTGESRRIFT
jgi:hypothetical protein